MTTGLDMLHADLTGFDGTASAWVGPAGGEPAFAFLPDTLHYAASTMKVALLGAAARRHAAGDLDLDVPVPVINDFVSAASGAPRFAMDQAYDQDDEVWARLGTSAPLRWLARRMIIRSSNLATNIVLAHLGLDSVGDLLRAAGVTRMTVRRGIEDAAAREAGIDNKITAGDLARLLVLVTEGPWSRGVLLDQEFGEDLKEALPPGVPIAQKDGWVQGVRHSAGIVYPDDAPPFVVAVATTANPQPADAAVDGPVDGLVDVAAAARILIRRVAASAWGQRHAIAAR